MKRLVYILIALMVLGVLVSGCEMVVPKGDLSRGTTRGALKVDFYHGQNWESIEGFVIVNRTPNGTTETTVQIHIWNANPNNTYRVRSGSNWIGGPIDINKKGKGNFHINLSAEDPGLIDYISIRCIGVGMELQAYIGE